MSQELLFHPRRHIPLEGTYNVRDCGGYLTREGCTVKWGVFFRADGLHRLTPQGQSVLVQQHGVQTIIDLRRSLRKAGEFYPHTPAGRRQSRHAPSNNPHPLPRPVWRDRV